MDDQILQSIAKCCNYDISKLYSYTRLYQVTSNIWYLVTQLEDQFGCSLPNDKVKKFVTVGDLINAIKRTKGNWSNSSSYNQHTSREELYRKAQGYIENNDYSLAKKALTKLACNGKDVWGLFAVYDICKFSEKLNVSDNEMFQLAIQVVDYYDFTSNFKANIDAHVCWMFLINHVGNLYYHGKGCSANAQRAFEYYQKAVFLGMPVAMYNVGFCYFEGRGVEENHKEALYWYIKSKEAGMEGIDDTISQLCNELKVSSSIKSTDPYFSKKDSSENKKASNLADLSPNEQEFVNLVKQLSANSALTNKKIGVLKMAGNRLNIPNDRCFKLLEIVLQQ